LSETQLAAPRRLAGKASILRSTRNVPACLAAWEHPAVQRSLSLTSLRGAQTHLSTSKTTCANMPFPCSLSTSRNAPPLFFLQTNPNGSVSGLRAERSEASKSAQRRVRVKTRTLPRNAPRFEKPGFDPPHCHALASLPAKPTFILQHFAAFQGALRLKD